MADMICTKCGREAVAGKRFCGGCGGTLQVVAESAQPQQTARFCVKCGTPNAPGKRFCKQCGHAVGTTAPRAAIQHEATAVHIQAANVVKPAPEEAGPLPTLSVAIPLEPSQVLLSQAVPKSEQDQPAWLYSEESPNLSSIGRSFSRLTNLDRVEQETSAPPEVQAEPRAAHVHGAITTGGSAAAYGGNTLLRRNDKVSTSRGNRNLLPLIGAVCATAVAVGIVLFFAVTHHWWRNPAQVATQAALPTVAIPASTAGQPLQSQPTNPVAVTRNPAASTKPDSRKKKNRRQEAPEDSRPSESAPTRSQIAEQKTQGDNCSLSPNILPKMLDQAERNREQGNYPAAVRQYRAVLSCDHNNARARSGLETALLDIQHQ